jgi:hypothetical protein
MMHDPISIKPAHEKHQAVLFGSKISHNRLWERCKRSRGITHNLTLLGWTTLLFEQLTREKMAIRNGQGDDSGQLIKEAA